MRQCVSRSNVRRIVRWLTAQRWTLRLQNAIYRRRLDRRLRRPPPTITTSLAEVGRGRARCLRAGPTKARQSVRLFLPVAVPNVRYVPWRTAISFLAMHQHYRVASVSSGDGVDMHETTLVVWVLKHPDAPTWKFPLPIYFCHVLYLFNVYFYFLDVSKNKTAT